jgi:uncharacterized protein YuzE
MLNTQNNIDYDKKFDVLYYNMEDTGNSYGDEIDNNIVILRDIETDRITGVTIIGFDEFFIMNKEKRKELSNYIDASPITSYQYKQ